MPTHRGKRSALALARRDDASRAVRARIANERAVSTAPAGYPILGSVGATARSTEPAVSAAVELVPGTAGGAGPLAPPTTTGSRAWRDLPLPARDASRVHYWGSRSLPQLPASLLAPRWQTRPASKPVSVVFFGSERMLDASLPVPREVFEANRDLLSFEESRAIGGIGLESLASPKQLAAAFARIADYGTYEEYLDKANSKTGNQLAKFNKRQFDVVREGVVKTREALKSDALDRKADEAFKAYERLAGQPRAVVATGTMVNRLLARGVDLFDVLPVTKSRLFDQMLKQWQSEHGFDPDLPLPADSLIRRPGLIVIGEPAGDWVMYELTPSELNPLNIAFFDDAAAEAMALYVDCLPRKFDTLSGMTDSMGDHKYRIVSRSVVVSEWRSPIRIDKVVRDLRGGGKQDAKKKDPPPAAQVKVHPAGKAKAKPKTKRREPLDRDPNTPAAAAAAAGRPASTHVDPDAPTMAEMKAELREAVAAAKEAQFVPQRVVVAPALPPPPPTEEELKVAASLARLSAIAAGEKRLLAERESSAEAVLAELEAARATAAEWSKTWRAARDKLRLMFTMRKGAIKSQDLISMNVGVARVFPTVPFSPEDVTRIYATYADEIATMHRDTGIVSAQIEATIESVPGTSATAVESVAMEGAIIRAQAARARAVLRTRMLDITAALVKRTTDACGYFAGAGCLVWVLSRILRRSKTWVLGALVFYALVALIRARLRRTIPRPNEHSPLGHRYFGLPAAHVEQVMPFASTTCFGPTTDLSTLDPKHKIDDLKFECDNPNQKGARVVGPVFALPQVARQCLCNAKRAIVARHGVVQPPHALDLVKLCSEPGVSKLRRDISLAYPSALQYAEATWCTYVGSEVVTTKWSQAKTASIIRSVVYDTPKPSKVKAFVKREVSKADVHGNLMTKPRLIQGYINEATAEFKAREFNAFQKAFAQVASVSEPAQIFPGVHLTFGSGLNADQIAEWGSVPAKWYYERDATNWDATVNHRDHLVKFHFYDACCPTLGEFARLSEQVDGFVQGKHQTLKYRLAGTVKSGHNDTTSGNSLVNGLISCAALYEAGCTGRVIVAGDDCLVAVADDFSQEAFDKIVATERAYGKVPKAAAFAKIENASFISGAFLRAPRGLVFVPQIGRLFCRLWSTTRTLADKHIPAYKMGVAAGFANLYNIPLYRAFIARDYSTMEMKIDAQYKVNYNCGIDHDPDHWYGVLCDRYKISRPDVDALCDFLRAIPTAGAFACSHPVATKIIDRDCCDVGVRPGNLSSAVT